MTRILYVTSAGESGGAETVLLQLLDHIDRRQFEPAVVCLQDGNFVEELKSKAQVDVEVIPAGRLRDLTRAFQVVRQLVERIDRGRFRLVHCNGTTAHLYGGLAGSLCGVPAVYHVHDAPEFALNKQGLVDWLATLIPSSATVAVSNYVAERFKQRWRPSRQIHVIHNGIDVQKMCRGTNLQTGAPTSVLPRAARGRIKEGEYKNPKSKTCPEQSRRMENPKFLWCGRLQRWKGAHVFLQAAALVHRELPAATFMVVGGTLFGLDVSYAAELRDLAERLNLNGSVCFTGHVRDARPFIAAADVIVHSAIQPEPFGLVILEAMAIGKPVIASYDGGPTEIVESSITGALVPPNDSEKLAHAMMSIGQDAGLREKMGKAARDRAERIFSVSFMIARFEKLYYDLASASPARRNAAHSRPHFNPLPEGEEVKSPRPVGQG